MRSRRIIWITQTGVFLAVLIVAQAATRLFGNQFVTGSINNMLFVLVVMLCGLSSAATLCAISPMVATLLGIGPLWPFVPVIIAGNILLVVLWYLIALRRPTGRSPEHSGVGSSARSKGDASTHGENGSAKHNMDFSSNHSKGDATTHSENGSAGRSTAAVSRKVAALIAAAIAKFSVVYFGIVHMLVPLVLKLGEPQASAVSAAFSWPQLVTASVGGLLALLLSPALSKALPLSRR